MREIDRQALRRDDAVSLGDDLSIIDTGVIAAAVCVDPLSVLAVDIAAACGQRVGVVDRAAQLDVVAD